MRTLFLLTILSNPLFHLCFASTEVKLSLITVDQDKAIFYPLKKDFYRLQGTSALKVDIQNGDSKQTEVYAFLPVSEIQISEMFLFPLRGLRKLVDKGNAEKRIDGHFQKLPETFFDEKMITPLNLDSRTADYIYDQIKKLSSDEEPVTFYYPFTYNSSAALGKVILDAFGKKVIDSLNEKGLPDDPKPLTYRNLIKVAIRQALESNYGKIKILSARSMQYNTLLKDTKEELTSADDFSSTATQIELNVKKLATENPEWYQGLFERVSGSLADPGNDREQLVQNSLITAKRLKTAVDALGLTTPVTLPLINP